MLTSSISTIPTVKTLWEALGLIQQCLGCILHKVEVSWDKSPLLINFALHSFPSKLQESLITFHLVFWRTIGWFSEMWLKKMVAQNPVEVWLSHIIPGLVMLKRVHFCAARATAHEKSKWPADLQILFPDGIWPQPLRRAMQRKTSLNWVIILIHWFIRL